MSEFQAHIRPYIPQDRQRIFDICCDCAFLGDPIDQIFIDREWFGSVMIFPYLVLEPEHTWVAEVDDQVVGYLTGSIYPLFGYYRVQLVVLRVSQLAINLFLNQYDAHPRSKQFAQFVIQKGLSQIPSHPRNTGHFHFNVQRPYRGQGIGKKLIAAFEALLRSKGMHQYYAEVMSSGAWRPESYFKALGYECYDKVATTIFEAELEKPLYVLCVVRQLPYT